MHILHSITKFLIINSHLLRVTDVNWWRYCLYTWLLFSVSAVLLSTFILLFLPSSSVSLSHFNLAVPMRKCSERSCRMSSPFSIGLPAASYLAILKGTCSLRSTITVKTLLKWSAIKLNSPNKKQYIIPSRLHQMTRIASGAPLEFFFQEQSYSSLHSGWSLA